MRLNNVTRTWEGIEIPAPGRWTIDPERSRAEFVIRYLIAAKVRGRFRRFSGTIEVGDRPQDTRLEVEIDADSVDTGIRPLDRLLRSHRFLDPERFPALRFRSTDLEPVGGTRFRLSGELTVRDVTRPVVLEVDYQGVVMDPATARFRGSAEVDRHEFGMSWHRLLEIQGWLVRRRLRIELEIEVLHSQDA